MNKIVKMLGTILAVFSIINLSSSSVMAHDLTRWANYYTDVKANSTNSFSIEDTDHINGRVAYYTWENDSIKSNYNTALLQAESAWGGMIDIVENDSLACFRINYMPNTCTGQAAYVKYNSPCEGHYSADGITTDMVICSVMQSYSTYERKQVFTHELGHVWGISDIYKYHTDLQSIYSDAYAFDAPTRHDINAMYICQDRPWYKDANANWKFLKAPGSFAVNEWAYTMGYQPSVLNKGRYYFNSSGILVTNANTYYDETFEAYSIGSNLTTGQTLLYNQYLSSPNKKYIAKMQGDGNFVVYNTDSILWETNTDGLGTGAKCIKVQSDGNIVMYDSSSTPNVIWNLWSQSGVNNRKAVKLSMQNDGNLVAYDSSGSAIWYIGANNSGVSTFNVVTSSQKNSVLSYTTGSTSIGSTLASGQTLSYNQYLSSPNNKFIAKMQGDGNFVVYNSDSALWMTSTAGAGSGAQYITVQSDGNVVMYDSSSPRNAVWDVWDQAGAYERNVNTLTLQNDGNLVAYSVDGSPIWWTQTNGAYGAGTFSTSR